MIIYNLSNVKPKSEYARQSFFFLTAAAVIRSASTAASDTPAPRVDPHPSFELKSTIMLPVGSAAEVDVDAVAGGVMINSVVSDVLAVVASGVDITASVVTSYVVGCVISVVGSVVGSTVASVVSSMVVGSAVVASVIDASDIAGKS